MAHWLIKSEPGNWSWHDQMKAGGKGTSWNGVRNHSAKQNLMVMRVGEQAFFYHSGEALKNPVSLDAIKADPRFAKMALVTNPRLSVQPVSDREWNIIRAEGG